MGAAMLAATATCTWPAIAAPPQAASSATAARLPVVIATRHSCMELSGVYARQRSGRLARRSEPQLAAASLGCLSAAQPTQVHRECPMQGGRRRHATVLAHDDGHEDRPRTGAPVNELELKFQVPSERVAE